MGGLDIRRNGRPLTFPTRHCGLVLAILALAPGQRMSREALVALLWSARGEAQAMASLRQTLYHLRKTLGDLDPPPILADRRQVGLRGIRSDVDAVRQAAATDPAALPELFGGPLLFGCAGIDPAFDDWLRIEQAALSDAVSEALRAHAARSAEAGRHGEASRAAAALLRLDPLDEAAAQLQMAALAATGQRSAALALCSEIAGRLRAELGVEPDAATVAMRDRIAASRCAPAPEPAPPSSPVAVPASERRAVTLLALMPAGAPADPELFAGAIAALRARVADALEPGSGELLSATGQGVLVVFAAGESHAVAAARFAWQIGAGQAGLRCGLASGPALLRETGGAMRVDPDGAGPLIAAAGALAADAAPGEIRVSPEMAAALAGFFALAPAGASARLLAETGATNRWQAWQDRPSAPFVGRAAELAKLLRMRERAAAGEGRVVAVVGDAGIGKSRLVHEFLKAEPAGRATALELTLAERMQARPFGPLPRFLADWQDRYGRAALDPDSRQALDAVLGGSGARDWTEREAGDRRRRIIGLVRNAVAIAARAGPLILVVEDMHWIDSETEALLDAVVLDLHAAPVLVVATYRPEYQSRWVGRSLFELIRLRPLAGAAIEDLIAGLGGDPRKLRARITESAGGIPLFVEELVRADLAEEGPQGTPATIADLLAARLGQLPAPARRLLLTASVLGVEAPQPLLARLAEMEAESFDDALAALLASELLVRAAGGGLRFRHALIHEVAYGTLLNRDRRELHRRTLALLSGEGADPAVLAYHARACRDWEAASRWFRAAGDAFAEITACSQARDAYLEALDAARQVATPDPRAELELHLRLRPVLVPLGDYGQARAHLEAAEALSGRLGKAALAAKVHISKSYLFSTHGALDEAVTSAGRAAGHAGGTDYLAAEARLALGQALSLRGDIAGTRAALEPALPFYDAHPTERFFQTGTRAIWCHGHLAHVLCLSGDLPRAEAHADRALALAGETARPLDRVFAMHRRGDLLLERGAFAEAAAQMEEAMEIAEAVDAPLFKVWFGCDLAPAHISLGRIEDARRLLARQEPEARRLALHQFAACLALRWGELALVEGREDETERRAAEALKTARAAGYLVLETAALRLAGALERRRGAGQGTLDGAAALAERRGLEGEARRARLAMTLPCGVPGTI